MSHEIEPQESEPPKQIIITNQAVIRVIELSLNIMRITGELASMALETIFAIVARAITDLERVIANFKQRIRDARLQRIGTEFLYSAVKAKQYPSALCSVYQWVAAIKFRDAMMPYGVVLADPELKLLIADVNQPG